MPCIWSSAYSSYNWKFVPFDQRLPICSSHLILAPGKHHSTPWVYEFDYLIFILKIKI